MSKISRKEKEKMFDFLCNHASNIQKCLRLTHYRLVFVDSEKKEEAAMIIHVNPQYLEADVDVFQNMRDHWKKRNYQTIIEVLTHEICHIIVDPMYRCYEVEVEKQIKKVKDKDYEHGNFFREKVTEHISRWGTRLYNNFMKVNNINIKTGKCTRIYNSQKSSKV